MISIAVLKQGDKDSAKQEAGGTLALRPGLSQMLIEEYLEKAHHQKEGISRLLSCSTRKCKDCIEKKGVSFKDCTTSSVDLFCCVPGGVWLCGLVPLLGVAELSAVRASGRGQAKCVTDPSIAQVVGETARHRLALAMRLGQNAEESANRRKQAKELIDNAIQSLAQVSSMELESLVASANSQSTKAILSLTEIILGEITPSLKSGDTLVKDPSDTLKKLRHLDYESMEPSVVLRLRRHASSNCRTWREQQRDQPKALSTFQLLINAIWKFYEGDAVVWERMAGTAAISDVLVQELRASVQHGAQIDRFCRLVKAPAKAKQNIRKSKDCFSGYTARKSIQSQRTGKQSSDSSKSHVVQRAVNPQWRSWRKSQQNAKGWW